MQNELTVVVGVLTSVNPCQFLIDFNKEKGTLILLSESVVTWAQNMVAAATLNPRTRRPDKFRV